MPLEVVEIRDLKDFTEEFIDEVLVPGIAPATNNDVTTGWQMGHADGNSRGSFFIFSVYDHIRDRRLYQSPDTKQTTGGSTAIEPVTYMHDALCRNASVGWARDTLDNQSSSTRYRLLAGQPNLQTGEQKFYSHSAAGSIGHFEFDMVNGTIVQDELWPGIRNSFHDNFDVAPDGNTAGFFDADTGVNNTQEFQTIIFEGITDTTGWEPGNAASNEGILRGGNSHPQGLALMPVANVNFNGDGGGNNLGRRWIWIDLDTQLAVGVLGIPTVASSSSTNAFAEPTIAGETFNWDQIQFVPDIGSTFAQPKGELVISTAFAGFKNVSGQQIVAPEMTFTSNVTKNYVAVHDFNPFNVQTGVVRVHNRRTFVGEVLIPHEPIIQGGFNANNSDDGFNRRSSKINYHPPSRTFFNIASHPATNPDDTAEAPAVGHSRIIRWRRAAVVAHISQPTPDTAVTENRTVRARVIASTDLAQRAVAVQLNFTLTRRSTRAETFDGASVGSGTYTVEADVIDEDGSLEVYEGNDIDNGGTLLAETTDYTVNYSTGVLTPVGSWPSDDIYVRYRHRDVGLTPAHGTLLNSSAVTDGNGVVEVLIRYGEDIDGELDGIEASTE